MASEWSVAPSGLCISGHRSCGEGEKRGGEHTSNEARGQGAHSRLLGLFMALGRGQAAWVDYIVYWLGVKPLGAVTRTKMR
jgi:hypothetical protein